MKKNRHEAILSLIDSEVIATQEELMLRLNDLGYKVTQATVSRDIKQLKLVKTPASGGRYRYSYIKSEFEENMDKYYSILSNSVLSVNYAANIVVVKCVSGMANAACACIDNLVSESIVGTLAGDDTFLVICTDEGAAAEFKKKLEKTIA